MNRKTLAIATISLARTPAEESTLCHSLKALARLGYPIFVTDGGSPAQFVSFLEQLPNVTVLADKGLWPQARKSITAAAAAADAILYTEPDKASFFENDLPQMLAMNSTGEGLGVVLAARSAKGFTTFPAFQQMTETTINACCREIIGLDEDYCYGPFLFNSQLASGLSFLPETCGWGWRPALFTIAHRTGLPVTAFRGDFSCPPDQRQDDEKERQYRMKQMTQNIDGLLLAATAAL